jgi:hypothetical protein
VKRNTIDPGGVERYLESKFLDALPELAQRGFGLYEQFRPVIPEGVQGWGAKGELDLGRISKLANQTH